MNLEIVNSDIDNLGGARYDLAAVHAYLKQPDEAIQWLERIFKDGSWFDHYYAAIDPLLEPLRQDPRFQSILLREKKRTDDLREKVLRMDGIAFLD